MQIRVERSDSASILTIARDAPMQSALASPFYAEPIVTWNQQSTLSATLHNTPPGSEDLELTLHDRVGRQADLK